MPSEIVIRCSNLIAKMNLTIAFAESATAGRLSYEFSLTPKSGKILKGGIVCYDAGLKEDLLNVPKKLVDQYTPESAEVTEAAALGLRKIVSADLYIAVTGLISPGGSETKEKPVGTMFIHGIQDIAMFSERIFLSGDAESIVMKTVDEVAYILIKKLSFDY